MLRAALLWVVLAGPLSSSRIDALTSAAATPDPALTELARIAGPLLVLAPPSVAEVRSRLAATHRLETEARRLLSKPAASPTARARTHLVLAAAWARLAQIEEALAIEGEGEGPVRSAVRDQATGRAQDAEILANSELQNCAQEPRATPDIRSACRSDSGPSSLRTEADPAGVVASRRPEVAACLQEALFAGEAAPGHVVVHLQLGEGDSPRPVSTVSFVPAPASGWASLAACLQTRFLGWRLGVDADEIELPLDLSTR